MKRATMIEKIYAERGFEGTLKWIEERRGQKLSHDLETITREMHLYFLHRINAGFRQSAVRQKREAEKAARIAEMQARMQTWLMPDTKSPEEIAADQARIRAQIEANTRAIREHRAAAEEKSKMMKEIAARTSADQKTNAETKHGTRRS